MPKIHLGLVPYLNVKPLIYPLLSGELRHNFSLHFAPPSQLSKDLKKGKLDAALIPSIEYASSDGYLILPELAIAARGAVRSVLLYSKKPFSEIETVALDTASRTSASLVKILLAQRLKRQPKYIEATPPLAQMLKESDAALIIGDNALQTPAKNYYQMDLAEEWLNLTGQPFVFAFFAAHPFKHLEETWQTLLRAKSMGTKKIPLIAYRESLNLGLSYFTCLDYLIQRISYDLSPAKLAGLESFYRLARANNLIRKDVTLKFYQQKEKFAPLVPRWRLANA